MKLNLSSMKTLESISNVTSGFVSFPSGLESSAPFIQFTPFEIDYIKIAKNLGNAFTGDIESLITPIDGEGSIYLPFPNGSLNDGFTNSWDSQASLASDSATKLLNYGTDTLSKKFGIGSNLVDTAKTLSGLVIDPAYLQSYKGTSIRSWSCSYQLLPQSLEDAKNLLQIIKKFKIWSSPSKEKVSDKSTGLLRQPYIVKVKFHAPNQGDNNLIQNLINFKPLVINRLDINYSGNGYPTTFEDGVPKQISLSIGFNEYGLKYRDDWEKMETI